MVMLFSYQIRLVSFKFYQRSYNVILTNPHNVIDKLWEKFCFTISFFSRKNPVHFQEYSHEQPSEEDEEESLDDLPECPYGQYCYRQNPRHRKEYKHTPRKSIVLQFDVTILNKKTNIFYCF